MTIPAKLLCYFPNCRNEAKFTPVVALPTIRTAGESNEMVVTDKATHLLFKEVCQKHKDNYNILDWFQGNDWDYVQEAARHHGRYIPDPHLIEVMFKPIGWTPNRSLELERGQ